MCQHALVKNGILDGASSKTITLGEAFENYFDNPEWYYGIDEDGDDIVAFCGETYYYEDRVYIAIQFVIGIQDSSFTIWVGLMDGYEMEDILTYGLISKALESVGVDWNPFDY